MSDSPIQLRDTQTLRYRALAARNVPRDTVRVGVTVTALVSTADHDHAALTRRIREALGRFIPTEWVLMSPRRQQDASGYERVQVEATTRAPLEENYNLAERARMAGQEGLSLTEPTVDHRLPSARVAAAVQALRLTIVREALAQAKEFGEASGQAWELADIEFGVAAPTRGYRSGKGAVHEELDDLEYDDRPEPATERIRLMASVILRAAGR